MLSKLTISSLPFTHPSTSLAHQRLRFYFRHWRIIWHGRRVKCISACTCSLPTLTSVASPPWWWWWWWWQHLASGAAAAVCWCQSWPGWVTLTALLHVCIRHSVPHRHQHEHLYAVCRHLSRRYIHSVTQTVRKVRRCNRVISGFQPCWRVDSTRRFYAGRAGHIHALCIYKVVIGGFKVNMSCMKYVCTRITWQNVGGHSLHPPTTFLGDISSAPRFRHLWCLPVFFLYLNTIASY